MNIFINDRNRTLMVLTWDFRCAHVNNTANPNTPIACWRESPIITHWMEPPIASPYSTEMSARSRWHENIWPLKPMRSGAAAWCSKN